MPIVLSNAGSVQLYTERLTLVEDGSIYATVTAVYAPIEHVVSFEYIVRAVRKRREYQLARAHKFQFPTSDFDALRVAVEYGGELMNALRAHEFVQSMQFLDRDSVDDRPDEAIAVELEEIDQ